MEHLLMLTMILWVEKMTQWTKHLPHKYEDIGVNPHDPHQVTHGSACICNPNTPAMRWEADKKIPGSVHASSQTYTVTSNKRPHLKQGGNQEPTPEVVLWPLHNIVTHLPILTHSLYTHTHRMSTQGKNILYCLRLYLLLNQELFENYKHIMIAYN